MCMVRYTTFHHRAPIRRAGNNRLHSGRAICPRNRTQWNARTAHTARTAEMSRSLCPSSIIAQPASHMREMSAACERASMFAFAGSRLYANAPRWPHGLSLHNDYTPRRVCGCGAIACELSATARAAAARIVRCSRCVCAHTSINRTYARV